jgi:fatty-acyl-CoA synthase
LPVRYYDWIAHFGRRTPDKVAVVDLASERVAVLALNTTDTLEVQFACGRIGAVFLPHNTRLTVPELQYIVGDAAPVLMVHDAELAEVALSVAKLCSVRSALLLGPGGSYEAAIAASRPLEQAEAAR